jgi:hypothetical protein
MLTTFTDDLADSRFYPEDKMLLLIYQTTWRHIAEVIAIRTSDHAPSMFRQNSAILSDM